MCDNNMTNTGMTEAGYEGVINTIIIVFAGEGYHPKVQRRSFFFLMILF